MGKRRVITTRGSGMTIHFSDDTRASSATISAGGGARTGGIS
jgi:hypothetical protein